MLLHILIFLFSFVLLFWTGKWLIKSLSRIARYLEWREFVVAFFIVAIAASIPNLFVGISSAFHKIPELSFGDIVGGNLVDLTLAVAIAVLLSRGGLPAESKMVQTSAVFTMAIAILPLLLILDGYLGRGDALILISVFIFYIFWLFSKKERFSKVYDSQDSKPVVKKFRIFIKDLGRVILGVFFLLLAAEGVVRAASFFADSLNLPLALVGILIVGLGNAIPETYFAVIAARKAQNWMILGDLMGSVIVAATLVLGIVALISPIKIVDFSTFAIARFFLIISAIFFLIFVRTDRKITKREALFLLGIYIIFVLAEILTI
jgi:cation:H+ antiporter